MTMARRNPRQSQGFSLLKANHELPNMHSSQVIGNWESLQRGLVEDRVWDFRAFKIDMALSVPLDEYPVILEGDEDYFNKWVQTKRARYNHSQEPPSYYATRKADSRR
jgi:hypothetical protein